MVLRRPYAFLIKHFKLFHLILTAITAYLLKSSITVSAGTKLSKIIKDLPTEITVTDSNGKTVKISGVWTANNYNAKQEGVYKVTFQSVLPNKLVDTFDMLQIEVSLTDLVPSRGDYEE